MRPTSWHLAASGAGRLRPGRTCRTVASVWLDREVDRDEVRQIILDAYRKVGPKKLMAQLDG